MPARRYFLPTEVDSAYRVDLYAATGQEHSRPLALDELVVPCLDYAELRALRDAVDDALAGHPQEAYVVGPDGRLWCPPCAEGGRADECDGHACPGDNAAARAIRDGDAVAPRVSLDDRPRSGTVEA